MMNMKKLSLREFAEIIAALMNKNGTVCFVNTHGADGQMALTCVKGNRTVTSSVDDLWRAYNENGVDIQDAVQTMSIAFSEALNDKNQDAMNASQTQNAVQNIPQNPQFANPNPRTANTMNVMPRADKAASTCQCGNDCSNSCGSQATKTDSMKPISDFLEFLMKDVQSQMDSTNNKKTSGTSLEDFISGTIGKKYEPQPEINKTSAMTSMEELFKSTPERQQVQTTDEALNELVKFLAAKYRNNPEDIQDNREEKQRILQDIRPIFLPPEFSVHHPSIATKNVSGMKVVYCPVDELAELFDAPKNGICLLAKEFFEEFSITEQEAYEAAIHNITKRTEQPAVHKKDMSSNSNTEVLMKLLQLFGL